tara:strand:- start:9 stop:779 length:771 start_codon:yes stop_codon:yes gene_type:complete
MYNIDFKGDPIISNYNFIELSRDDVLNSILLSKLSVFQKSKITTKRLLFKSFHKYFQIKLLAIKLKNKHKIFSKCNYSEIDPYFLHSFIKFSHPYGITLSCDFIGANCQISQLSTIGTNIKYQRFDELTYGVKPKIGFCIKTNPTSVISGPVHIGSFSIIAAGAVVTKDVPPFSFVKGTNDILPIKKHHIKTFIHQLYNFFLLSDTPAEGICWANGYFSLSREYSSFAQEIKKLFEKSSGEEELIKFFIDHWNLKI